MLSNKKKGIASQPEVTNHMMSQSFGNRKPPGVGGLMSQEYPLIDHVEEFVTDANGNVVNLVSPVNLKQIRANFNDENQHIVQTDKTSETILRTSSNRSFVDVIPKSQRSPDTKYIGSSRNYMIATEPAEQVYRHKRNRTDIDHNSYRLKTSENIAIAPSMSGYLSKRNKQLEQEHMVQLESLIESYRQTSKYQTARKKEITYTDQGTAMGLGEISGFTLPAKGVESLATEEADKSQSKNVSAKRQDTSYIDRLNCEICLNTVSSWQADSPLLCGHTFCVACYIDYLHDHILARKVLKIKCPKDTCQEKFEDHHIKNLLDRNVYNYYIHFKKLALVMQNPNLRWCVTPGCEKYVIGKKGDKKVVCECGTQICFKCGSEYHSQKSCDAVIDKVYDNYAKENHLQPCPQCKSGIEKAEGCNHMTCPICSYQWCWLCGKKYTDDHFSDINKDGCAGMLHADALKRYDSTEEKTSSMKILSTLSKIIFLPALLIAYAIYVPQWLYSRSVEGHNLPITNNNKSKTGVCTKVLLIILGILILPLSIFIAIWYLIRDSCASKKEIQLNNE